ncbi:MAG TPA: CerR family C-terminal domain-containing protein [Steroidobacteraceae bacterium]|nr:CerR family C-terminal domain-containing protein [Steroidobacteraceae bacterium]
MAHLQEIEPGAAAPPPRRAPGARAPAGRAGRGASLGAARAGTGTGGARSARTRARLLEAAGQLFAAQGVDRVTGQQICRRAGVHSAAIVYHFGGMAGLYPAVLAEAQRRLLTTAALAAAVDAESDPRRKLRAFISLIVQRLASPVSESWAARLFGREFVAPSAIYGPTHDRILAERATILRGIIAELCALPPRDPAVARAAISIMAPCAVMLVFNRRKMSRLMPGVELTSAAAPLVARHLLAFALGGLRGLAAARGGLRVNGRRMHARRGGGRRDAAAAARPEPGALIASSRNRDR